MIGCIRCKSAPPFRDRLQVLSASIIVLAATSTGAIAQKKYDTGATDTEIKIGNIMPYSGPASAYGVIGKTEAAYFKKINAEGGINGRKIKFISYDDAYSPPKAVEQARKLVAQFLKSNARCQVNFMQPPNASRWRSQCHR